MSKSCKSSYVRRPQLAEPLHRLAGRWRNGGVEEYPLGVFEAGHRGRWRRRTAGFELSEHRIRMRALPESFRGFRIVQLTDIHHGLYLPEAVLAEAVELVNQLEPDLIVLTGDFVTFSRAYIEPAAEILGRLKAPQGRFAVLGNHDFRVGAGYVTRALRGAGLDVLRNRHTVLRRHGRPLYLAGVDAWPSHAELSCALSGIPRSAPIILLSHHPGIIRRAARAGVTLVLAGHTHGGQIHLPVVGSIYGRSAEQLRFKIGWAQLEQTQIYVSRGIGTVLLPLRYRCAPEIPRFHLYNS